MSEVPATKIDSKPARRRFLFLGVLCAFLALGGAAAAAGIWYHRFNNHVTPQEESHEVRHITFDASIRTNGVVKLQVYQQANANAQPLVIFTSGDGGWSPFCADIAAHIAATGKTVVGLNAKEYLTTFASSQKPVTPEELTSDYGEIISAALARPGVDTKAPVTLAGWSLGAGYSVLVSSDKTLKTRVNRVVAISLPNYNELAWKPTDALIYITHGTPREKVFEAKDYLPELTPLPLVMLNATDDDTSPLADARSLFESATGPRRFFAVRANGHHFEGGENEFYRDLDEGFSGIVG
jgi:dienelactone hydrolase